jgi:hypothetical protein
MLATARAGLWSDYSETGSYQLYSKPEERESADRHGKENREQRGDQERKRTEKATLILFGA